MCVCHNTLVRVHEGLTGNGRIAGEHAVSTFQPDREDLLAEGTDLRGALEVNFCAPARGRGVLTPHLTGNVSSLYIRAASEVRQSRGAQHWRRREHEEGDRVPVAPRALTQELSSFKC